MINEQLAHTYCKDDIAKIKNYDKAIDDTTQTWVVHHRLELTLDGEFAHSPSDLQRMNMYYDRPYFELIFLTRSEHNRLHKAGQACSADTRKKLSDASKGRTVSVETKRKMSEALKGKVLSDDTKMKMSEALKGRTPWNKGKKASEESCKKISEALKGRTFYDETKKKIREALKGHTVSDETKQRISEARKAYLRTRNQQV